MYLKNTITSDGFDNPQITTLATVAIVQDNISLEAERKGLWVILAVGIAIRLVAMLGFKHVPESDELAYQSMAHNIINGAGIIDYMGNYAMYNLGYPVMVLTPLFAIFGENLWAVRLFNTCLGGLAIYLCYAVAKEAGAKPTGRLLAAALWAVYLPAGMTVVYLFKENLMIPLMLGVIWCGLRLLKTPHYYVGLVCGGLLGLLALTGNAALVLIVPIGAALTLAPVTLAKKLQVLAIIVLTAVVVTEPFLLRNKQVLGSFVLNTNGGFNLYLANNPMATGHFVSIMDTPRGSTWELLRHQGEVLASDTLKQEAIQWIITHPGRFFTLMLKKAGYFWQPSFQHVKPGLGAIKTTVSVVSGIEYLVIVTAALGSLCFACFRDRKRLILWLSISSYMAVYLVFYVMFRYRDPVLPFVCILAACCIESLVPYFAVYPGKQKTIISSAG